MKKRIALIAITLLLVSTVNGFALEYLWADDYGNRIFDCGGLFVGGRVFIKDRGRGIYRAKGVLINREIRANSIFHAAKIACGEASEEMPVEQEPVKKSGPDKKE